VGQTVYGRAGAAQVLAVVQPEQEDAHGAQFPADIRVEAGSCAGPCARRSAGSLRAWSGIGAGSVAAVQPGLTADP
jgi:hypothetical protein